MEKQVLKTCNNCGIEKPKTEYGNRGKGLKGDCKVYRSLEHNKYYYKDHEETKRKKRTAWHKSEVNRILKER